MAMVSAGPELKLHYEGSTQPNQRVSFNEYEKARTLSACFGAAAALEHDYGWFKTTQFVTSLYTYTMQYNFTAYFLSPVESDVAALGRIISKGAAWFSAKVLCTSTLRLVGLYLDGRPIYAAHVTPVINSAAKVALFAGKTFIFAAFLMPYLRVFTAAKCMTDIYEKSKKLECSYKKYLSLSTDYSNIASLKSQTTKGIAEYPKAQLTDSSAQGQVQETNSMSSFVVNNKEVVVAEFTLSDDHQKISAYYVREDELELGLCQAYSDCICSCCEIAMAFIELTVTFVVGIPFSEEMILALWATVSAGNMFSAYEGCYLNALSSLKAKELLAVRSTQ
jgi:hypothetical protein